MSPTIAECLENARQCEWGPMMKGTANSFFERLGSGRSLRLRKS